jgi:REP element-mobilizing transposase RayT
MPQSFISNNIHVVFSTKDRKPLIKPGEQHRVWAYAGGIAKNYGAVPLAIGGMRDHIHVSASLPATLSVAKFVNVLKSNSSKWLNERQHDFAWQSGYGAFTVSSSNLMGVTRYIENQEEHHRNRDFRTEFVAMLKKHRIAFEVERLFE